MTTKATEPDYFALLGDYSDRHQGKVLLHKLPEGWAVVLTTPKRSGEAKGRSPREAAQQLCADLGLEAKT